jgi:hypothetical protein
MARRMWRTISAEWKWRTMASLFQIVYPQQAAIQFVHGDDRMDPLLGERWVLRGRLWRVLRARL